LDNNLNAKIELRTD